MRAWNEERGVASDRRSEWLPKLRESIMRNSHRGCREGARARTRERERERESRGAREKEGGRARTCYSQGRRIGREGKGVYIGEELERGKRTSRCLLGLDMSQICSMTGPPSCVIPTPFPAQKRSNSYHGWKCRSSPVFGPETAHHGV